MTDLLLVPCPECNGSAVSPRAVWVYEHGCAFGHYDTEEDPCPACEGAGQTLVEGEPITMDDLEEWPNGLPGD
jgi:hypothetical protein